MAIAGLWQLDAVAIACAVAIAASYVRARPRTGGVATGLAIGVLVVALMSPVAVLADGALFSAHMLQHLLLVLIVPPLVLLGRPRRDAGAPTTPHRAVIAWLLGVGAMWLWHEPALCNAAARDPLFHAIQVVSLLVMGGAFWWPIVAPRRGARLAPLAAIGYLFTACLACTVLGILITLSPVAVCSAFTHSADWGLSPATDQQLGGLLMWVPACLIYGSAIIGSLVRMYGEDAAIGARGDS